MAVTMRGRVVMSRPVAPSRGFEPFQIARLAAAAPAVMREYGARPPFAAAGREAFFAALALSEGTIEARRNAERIFAGDMVTVTTGQQPGYCGGPFLVLLKIATAIAIAGRLRERGVPAAACFWNASDDTDFDEIAAAYLATGKLALVKRTLDPAGQRAGRVIGAVPLEAARPDLVEFFRAAGELDTLAEFGRRLDYTDGLWREAATEAPDLGWLTAQFIARLFAREGLVVIDARAPVLRAAARPLFARYLDARGEITAALTARARALDAAGDERVLDDGALDWSLFERRDDVRLRMAESDRLAAARRWLDETPPALSPNVVLRPIMEDELFPHVARVVGPAEMRYHDELALAYQVLSARRAHPVARLLATHLPPEAERIAERAGAAVADLWEEFDAVMGRAATASSPVGETARALASLRQDWERGLAAVRGTLSPAAGGWTGELERGAGKVDYELRRLTESLDDQARRALYKREPRLRELKNYLFPRGVAQERRLSTSSIVSLWGEETPAMFVDLAGQHLDELEEGRWLHFGVGDGVSGGASR